MTTGLVLRTASALAGPPQVDPTALCGLELPEFHLLLSRRDVAHFADLYMKYEDAHFGQPYYTAHNLWRRAKLEYNGRTYPIRIRAQARSPTGHRDGPWICYTVKLDNDEQIFNAPCFNLMIFKLIGVRPDRNAALCDLFGVVSQQDRLISLEINDWGAVPYYFESRFDTAYLESSGRASWVPAGDPRYEEPAIRDMTPGYLASDRYLPPTMRRTPLPVPLDGALQPVFEALHRQIMAAEPAGLEDFFDLDYIAGYEAVRLLGGFNGHGWTFDNLLLYYDTAGGLFYPFYHRACQAGRLCPGSGLETLTYVDPNVDFPLERLLCRNERIRQAKYSRLWPVVSSDQAVARLGARFAASDELERRLYHCPHWLDVLQTRFCGRRAQKNPAVVDNSFLLLDYISQSSPHVSAATRGDTLLIAVVPQSMSALSIEALEVNGDFSPRPCVRIATAVQEHGALRPLQSVEHVVHVEDDAAGDKRADLAPLLRTVELCDNVDETWQRAQRTYYIVADFPPYSAPRLAPAQIPLRLRNQITGQLFDLHEIGELKDADGWNTQIAALQFPVPEDRVQAWMQAHSAIPFRRSAEDTLVIPAGEYQLDQDLVLPPETDLAIEAGTTLRLAGGVSLVAFGSLDVRGTADAPVTVTAVDSEQPFGTVAVRGNSGTHCDIRHLHLSHGNEAVVAGIYFSGGLSLYHHDQVRIADSIISDNRADDGLNVKYADVVLEDSRFENNHADQVDLDVCPAIVRNCVFSAPPHPDYNGDGFDVSTSNCLVIDCRFEGLADKGLSVGEKSRVWAGHNEFEHCHLGIGVKDSSCCYLADNQFTDNQMAVFAYKKKRLWDGATVFLLSPAAVASAAGLFADAHSAFWRADAPGLSLAELPQQLPGWFDELSRQVDAGRVALTVQFKAFVAPPPVPDNRAAAPS